MRLKQGIETLMAKQNLNQQTCQQMVQDLLHVDSHPFQKVAFLVLLHSKTETAEELIGMVTALQENMVKIKPTKKVLDIVGTGGDGQHTVNISTGSAILAAACGVTIAKHGNSAVTSQSGSADVLSALGVNIHLSPEKTVAGINHLGIGFCFAPNFHPVLRELRHLRRSLNVPTSFNLLGPLLNPCQPEHILLGVYDAKLLRLMAETLQKSGIEQAMVVHGNKIDELSCLGPTSTVEVTRTDLRFASLDPKEFGFKYGCLTALQGGTAARNAALLRDALQGKSHLQTLVDTLVLNAATAVYLYGLQTLNCGCHSFSSGKIIGWIGHPSLKSLGGVQS